MSLSQVFLNFNSILNPRDSDNKVKEICDSLSAVVSVDKYLFLGGDETTTIERLETHDGGATFTNHQQWKISEFVKLPSGDDEEIDIEGMACSDRSLWIVGSHSLKRRQPNPKKTAAENIKRLVDVSTERNRYLLARIPLDSNYNLTKTSPSAQLEITDTGNILIDALKKDKHFKSFLNIPSKDNGIDIEGLAVSQNKIFIGLRGPVLRGWTSILELECKSINDSNIELKKIGSENQPYRKHFVQLGGLGVRDLIVDGQDLLILAGPTMDLDGPVEVFRWKNALTNREESLTWGNEGSLESVLKVPYGEDTDHAEGITFFASNTKSLMIVYDSPSNSRKQRGSSTIQADIFTL
ncbi:DUF3616 domain-containing protein [Pseudanabaena biceps]|nr:DUF3616 domain-containing protein [Pseudanabaena biceps]